MLNKPAYCFVGEEWANVSIDSRGEAKIMREERVNDSIDSGEEEFNSADIQANTESKQTES